MTREDLMAVLDDRTDLEIVSATVWAEARNQGVIGMAAVAATIGNRVKAATWYGADWRGVCLRKWQFSCWNVYQDGTRDANLNLILHGPTGKEWDQAQAIAEIAMAGLLGDPTGGATHYHTEEVSPTWAGSPKMIALKKIGAHSFYYEA